MNVMTRYVCSERIAPLSSLGFPYLALSCFDPGGLANGRVGFEMDEYTLAIRNALLQRSWTFHGNIVDRIENAMASASVPFCTLPEFPKQTARIVTRALGGLLDVAQGSNVSQEVLSEIANLQAKSDDLRRDFSALEELANLHISNGLEMQVWPYNTEYESYVILIGEDSHKLEANMRKFLEHRGIELSKIESAKFPRF